MREITSHKVNGCNEQLKIEAGDKGSGNASHYYVITGFDGTGNPANLVDKRVMMDATGILFQNGPIKEAGVNGITNEALIAVVIDRLQCFQTSEFACRENALALTKLEEAQHWLKHRTEARLARGVEGTHQK